MYCPSCGAEHPIELQYCNRCGANLNTGLAAPAPAVPISIAKPAIILGTIMIFLTLGGFGMVMSAAIELSRSARLGPDAITGIVIMGMLTILTTDIFLVRLLTKIVNASLSGVHPQPPPRRALANPSVIPVPQPSTSRLQGVPSVTEGTTRFFESAPTSSDVADRITADKLER